MNPVRILLVNLTPETRRVAPAAAREAFPGAEIVELATVEEAAAGGRRPGRELLVLAEPAAEAAAEAIHAVDASGLPRWAVVMLGGDAADLGEVVPREEWQVPLLARVFRSALLQHDLWRENLRLQGDLRSVARRISHDLYTPIGCIQTSAHVLKTSLSPSALRAGEVMLAGIDASAGEAALIVDRVRLVLRASSEPPAFARVEMAGVVAAVLRELEPEIRRSRARVSQPPSWPAVRGVAPWLHVIWWNLVKNAVQHGGPDPRVELGWNPAGDGCRFSVANRGPGVPAEIEPALFRPFDQLHVLPAPGLGLSVVQRLVALQDGRCGYERRADGSPVFSFTLPDDLSAGEAVAGGG